MDNTLLNYCQRMGLEMLLTQWDYEKNGTLTPDRVTYGSHAKAWWICEK